MSLFFEFESGALKRIDELSGFTENDYLAIDRMYYVDKSKGSEINELIYKRGTGDVVMTYYDSNEDVNHHKFQISEYSGENKYTVYFNDPEDWISKKYKITDKYNSVIQKGEYCQSALISFEDTSNQITAIGNYCFANCSNLTSIQLPSVKKIGTDAFYGCSNIENLNISSAQSIKASTFSSFKKLKKVYINSETLMMLDNGFGNDGEIVIDRKLHDKTPRIDSLVAVTTGAHKLSSDYVISVEPWLLNYGNFTELYLKNLSVYDTNIFSSSMKKLSVLEIDNDYSKSFQNTADHVYALPRDPNIKALVFSPDLKKLQYCGHKVDYLSCNTIKEYNKLVFQYQSLSAIDISNDVFRTIGHAVLVDALSTTVHFLIKGHETVNNRPDIFLNEHPSLTALSRYTINSYNPSSKQLSLDYVKLVKEFGIFNSMINGKIYMPELISVENNAFTACKPYELHFPKLSAFSDNMFTASNSTGSTHLLIDVPNLTSIGNSCFSNWDVITKYEFANGINHVKKIGSSAFSANKSLISIDLNECTSFGKQCLNQCWGLSTLCCSSIEKDYLVDISNYIGLSSITKLKNRHDISCYCSDGLLVI